MHCFDGYYGANETERSLVPVSRLEAWIEQNVYLRLKSVPFSKDDETLVPEAGSCANCPKRTGFNKLLFSEVREDSCTDAPCFNRKLDAHIARRKEKMPELVLISNEFSAPDGAPALTRRNYVEVVAQKGKGGKDSHPWNRTCNSLKTAIHTDGMDKGRLARVCAEPSCKVHFAEQQQAERQRLASKAQQAAENRKAKQIACVRHLLLAETLKRVKPQLNSDQLRLVARFVLASLPHEQAVRIAKRHAIEAAKNEHDLHAVEKARNLYKTASVPLVATQSISSLKTALPGETWRTLLQTFRTKIFLALADDFSAKVASELCGQDERWRLNYNISESGHDSRVSYLTGKPLADKAHISTSKTYSQQRDYRFDMKTFTELRNAQSITLAYDGLDPLPPMFCYLKPYFNDVNKSYFQQLAEGRL